MLEIINKHKFFNLQMFPLQVVSLSKGLFNSIFHYFLSLNFLFS